MTRCRRIVLVAALTALAACGSASPAPSLGPTDSGVPRSSICDPRSSPVLVGPDGNQIVLGDGPGGTSAWLNDDGMEYFLRQIGDCVWIIGYLVVDPSEPPFLTAFHGRLGTDFRIVGSFSDNTGVLIPGYDSGEFKYLITFDEGDVILLEDRTDSGPPGCSGGTGPCPPPRQLRRVADLQVEATDFVPPFIAVVPADWVYEGGSMFPSGGGEERKIDFARDGAIMAANCDQRAEAGVGRTARDIAAALATRNGLTVSGAVPTTIGGLSGQQVDLSIANDWTGACPWTLGSPTVPLFVYFDGNEIWGFVAAEPGERWRVLILDVPDGGNVIIGITAIETADFENHLAESMAILGTLKFDLGD